MPVVIQNPFVHETQGAKPTERRRTFPMHPLHLAHAEENLSISRAGGIRHNGHLDTADVCQLSVTPFIRTA